MDVEFYGWEIQYDDDQHLEAEQEPKAGKLYTMYHGTRVSEAKLIIQNGFRQSQDGMLGPGVYISRNQKKAERYPIGAPSAEKVVLKLSVDVGKVKKIDKDNHPMQKTWHDNGYDTAWVPPMCGMRAVPSGLEEDCVWDPKRIEVVDIVQTSANAILLELKNLLANAQKLPKVQKKSDNCKACKKKTEFPHQLKTCWGCGKRICIFMSKHVCI
nr:PREDICTED: uncharacterized protein LOC102355794 [Latimeria chalumnae]|eukprot:XP_005987295.1 PREDICTED: uncharacterized protein LOC102355794 [Latimeria chalumnae]